jgi:hypothetical protein
MNLKNYFDPSRFWLLLKLELFRSRKGLLMTLVIIFGLLFFASLLYVCVVEKKEVFDQHPSNYIFHLMFGGFALSSLAFKDLGNTLKRYRYLTLPASTFEKFICMWLLTSIGWIVLFTFTYTIYTIIANAIGSALFSRMTFLAFEPLSDFSMTTMRAYFVLHGIFLVGAVYFKGYVFPKTALVLILFSTVVALLGYFIMGEEFMNHDCGVGRCAILDEVISHDIAAVMQWIFWWVLAPVCWLNAYWGLKEQEV